MHEADYTYLSWSTPDRAIGSEWMTTAFTNIELPIRRLGNEVGPGVIHSLVFNRHATLQEFHTTIRTESRNNQWLMLCAFGILQCLCLLNIELGYSRSNIAL